MERLRDRRRRSPGLRRGWPTRSTSRHPGAAGHGRPPRRRRLTLRATSPRPARVPQEVGEVDKRSSPWRREHLGLRPSRDLRVRAVDGRRLSSAAWTAEDEPADVVVLDAFHDLRGAAPPDHRRVRRAGAARAAPGGLLAVNVVEPPPLLGHAGPSLARPVAAALAEAFEHLAVLSTRKVLRRRQGGNVVLVAGGAPLPVRELAVRARRGETPELVLAGDDAAAFAEGSPAPRDGDGGAAEPGDG